MKKIRLAVVLPTREQLAGLSKEEAEALVQQTTLKYKAMIQTALRTPLDRNAGVGIEEMERSLAILKKVEPVEDNGVLELDDVDFDYIIQKVNAVRWMGFDERIVSFAHTVKNATKDLLDEAPAETS